MSLEIDNKIEAIMISVINRLFNKEAQMGLDYEDLRCFEIIAKIKKDAVPVENQNSETKPETDPNLLIELISRARTFKHTDDQP